MRVLDSHLHLWDPSALDYSWLKGPLRARFAATELIAALGAVEDERAFVFIQADCAGQQAFEEVRWVASLAERVGVRAIVAGARLDRGAEAVEYLDAVAQHPLVVGVRHLLEGEVAGFAASVEFRAGAAALAERGLTFDACVRGAAQLRDVIALATDVPDLRIVLDHLGKPPVGTAAEPVAPSPEWTHALSALAAHPQVFCKLSGLPAEAGGACNATQVEPFLDIALGAFGAARLMFGSDWPVSAVTKTESGDEMLDATMMGSWADAVASWAASRELDVDAIMWRNGGRFYGLD